MSEVLDRYSVSTAKKNLSGLLADVERTGNSFVISRYGQPIAIVSTYSEDKKIQPKLKGVLNKFANPQLIDKEKDAWATSACKKFVK